MPADSQAHPPRFRIWLRRQNVADGPYSLRFEVQDGKGILRVARPGVLIDPPARALGMEERLSAAQLRSTRFILVWDGGRARQGHLLNRVDELQLERVETDRWHELEIVVDGGFRYAVLAVSMPPQEASAPRPKSRRPSLSELRQALDSITVHEESVEDVDSALASLTGPPPAPPRPIAEVAEAPAAGAKGAPPPPVIGARSSTAGVRYPASHEAQRPRQRGADAPGVASRPDVRSERGLDDAPTMSLDERRNPLPRPGAHDDAVLAFGAAGEPAEAGVHDPESSEDPLSDLPELPPMPVVPGHPSALAHGMGASPAAGRPAPSVPAPAGFPTCFSDEHEEAVFSIDLPSHRKSTEHVVVRRGDDEDGGMFEREELPPMPDLIAADPAEEEVPDDEVVLAADGEVDEVPLLGESEDEVLAAGDEDTTAHEVLPTPPPPRPAPPPPVAPAPPPAEAPLQGEGRALIRHLRRKEEQQRVRIAQLESELAELRAKLAGTPPRG